MDEKTIQKVAKILEEWNPLGDKANTIEDLDGYRTEAIDILSIYEIVFNNNIEKAVKAVIEQAFNIDIQNEEALDVANKIKLRLGL